MATVTHKKLYYEGSLTLGEDLMEMVGLVPYEKIQVLNVNNGLRLETYCIPGEKGSGEICLNGAAARWGEVGDKVIIMAFGVFSEIEQENWKPKVITVDKNNRLLATIS